MPYDVFVDQGGTFTDVVVRAPDGAVHTGKSLSGPGSIETGIRVVLERAGAISTGAPFPACRVRVGTTLATNALLERRGARVLLVTNAGLGDVFRIGTQARPDLFALEIRKPPPLHAEALELAVRRGSDGAVLAPLDASAASEALRAARARGLDAAAVVLMHAFAFPEDELRLGALARAAGFPYVALSHEVDRECGFLARGETCIADAYLTPVLRRSLDRLAAALPGSSLRFLRSSGGLSSASGFRGPAAVLSGPAGGALAAARIASDADAPLAVGFDMGGTSTDVCLLEAGEVERAFETEIAGLHLRTPMLRVHTVAAGGGSLCRFDGHRMTVGPASAGADPGPLCYGLRGPDGAPRGTEPALTDANLVLGRISAERFPLPLDREAAFRAFEALAARVRAAGFERTVEAVAAGFVEIANDGMAEAIRQVSVARGIDPRGAALVGFGGAAGQHLCAVARRLGIRTVLLHPMDGVLSALGIGVADPSWDGARDAGRAMLGSGGTLPDSVRATLASLEREGREALARESAETGDAPSHGTGAAASTAPVVSRVLELRYTGTEPTLAVDAGDGSARVAAFERAHRARFGYVRPGRDVEVVTARVTVRRGTERALPGRAEPQRAPARDAELTPPAPARVYFEGAGWVEVPAFERSALAAGTIVPGPALVHGSGSTLLVEPGFVLRVRDDGVLVLRDEVETGAGASGVGTAGEPDPVSIEVFGARFMSIAEQMGAVLRNTAVSTNMKDRLDFSCAVFDGAGGLVANAPHIPVHLGAMGETVDAVRREIPDLAPGDAVVTNDPYRGGSHLPDVTVVSPVFVEGEAAPAFFVATRGHHADIGGRSPGSMPADARTLAEEGIRLRAFRLVHAGRFDEERLRAALAAGPWPARSPDDNVADLEAMVAANRTGETRLAALAARSGAASVRAHMSALQALAGARVSEALARLPQGEFRFEDALDDGAPVRVRLALAGGRLEVDFAGTGAVLPGNLNAPPAVVRACVLYVLRSLVRERIPLNAGCMAPVTLRLPKGSLLDPPDGAAVAGGNVETSQRVVDVLLGALRLAAASQGTMNNVSFGTGGTSHYETIGGGAGALPGADGASGVHVHMTNTRITDAEVLELRAPVRLRRFALRRGSGGAGRYRGGDGLVREIEFLARASVSILAERRTRAPFGLAGGSPGACGAQSIVRGDSVRALPGHATVELAPGDRLVVETPGGGGFGAPSTAERGVASSERRL